MAESLWVGKDEYGGVRAQPRKDDPTPPHWRLEAIAQTPRPHSISCAAGLAVFVQAAAETSDVWLLDLEAGGEPERLTTGRAPAPYWEDTSAALSPDGSTVAYADEGHVWLVPRRAARRASSSRPARPVWLDDARLVVAVERDDTPRLAVVDVADPWPRRLAVAHGELDPHGDEGDAAVSPDGREVAFTFTPRADLNRTRDPRRRRRRRRRARGHGRADMHDNSPAWSPDGATLAYASERSGFYELHLAGAEDRPLTSAGADHLELGWHPDGTRLRRRRAGGAPLRPRVVDAATGEAEVVADGGTWGSPSWTPGGAIVATYEDHATPPELRLAGGGRTLHAPAPRAVAARPVRRARGGRVPLLRRPGDPGLPAPARDASAEHPVPASSIRTAAQPTPTSTTGTATRSTSSTRATRGWRSTSAARPARARLRAPQPRRLGRRRHARTASPRPTTCARSTGSTATASHLRRQLRLLHGAGARHRRPRHRFRCAVGKYGDCDLLTSWAQGDRDGVQYLERMMGHPRRAREAYRARLALPPPRERAGAAADRPRRARRAREPQAVRGAGRRAARGWARPSSTSPTRPRGTASCAPDHSSTSTAASSASSTGICM